MTIEFTCNTESKLAEKLHEAFMAREKISLTVSKSKFYFILNYSDLYCTEYDNHLVTFKISGKQIMPSSKNYRRDYKQERKTAKRRKETASGSSSGDATRHRARRKLINKVGKAKVRGKDVHHKKAIKHGGSNATSNLSAVSKKRNRSHGGKIGNRRGKAR